MLRMKPRELDDLHQREFAAEFHLGAGQGLSIEQSAERTLHADPAVPVRPQFKPCICHSVAKAGRSAGADNSHVAPEEQRREGAVEAHQLLAAAALDACLLARNTAKHEDAGCLTKCSEWTRQKRQVATPERFQGERSG